MAKRIQEESAATKLTVRFATLILATCVIAPTVQAQEEAIEEIVVIETRLRGPTCS
jgi:hypothetical protein